MANACRPQIVWHAVGLAVTLAAIGLLILGLILAFIFEKPDTGYWVAIVALVVGALMGVLTSVYAYCAFKNKWKLYGFVKLNFAQKSKLRTEYAQTLPSKEDDKKAENGYATHVGAAEDKDNFQPEWDPETVLTERY